MTTAERIEEDAEEFCNKLVFYDSNIVATYITAARTERNKVLDELLQKLDRGYKDYVWYKHLRAEIDSLKVNP